MRIDVFSQFSKHADAHMFGCTAIMVDVLRASTTIICAIKNGANQVIPAIDPGEVAAIAGRLGIRDSVLGGERGGLKLPGFNLGNSPLEYTKELVKDKTVILSTTNGTAAILSVKNAHTLLIGAMINRTAVAKAAYELGNNIVIQCAGTDGFFSADDMIATGAIIDAALKIDPDILLNDLSLCAHNLFKNHIDKTFDIATTTHYSRLKQLGFDADLDFCLTLDVTTVVPTYKNGVVVMS